MKKKTPRRGSREKMKHSLEQPCLRCGGPTEKTIVPIHADDSAIWNKRHCAHTALCNFRWYTRNGYVTYPSELKPVAGNWRTSPEGCLLIVVEYEV